MKKFINKIGGTLRCIVEFFLDPAGINEQARRAQAQALAAYKKAMHERSQSTRMSFDCGMCVHDGEHQFSDRVLTRIGDMMRAKLRELPDNTRIERLVLTPQNRLAAVGVERLVYGTLDVEIPKEKQNDETTTTAHS